MGLIKKSAEAENMTNTATAATGDTAPAASKAEYVNMLLKAVADLGVELPSLQAIAAVFNLQPPRIYAVAKQPKEGEVYDRNVHNYDAVDRFISKRLDPDKGPKTMEEVVQLAIAKDVEFKSKDGRRSALPVSDKTIKLASGEVVAKRRDEFVMGQLTMLKPLVPVAKQNTLKPDLTIYEVVYITDSHLVLRVQGGDELIAMSNNTVNWRLVPKFKFDEELAARKTRLENWKDEAAETANQASSETPATQA